jgi:hypothetical protein
LPSTNALTTLFGMMSIRKSYQCWCVPASTYCCCPLELILIAPRVGVHPGAGRSEIHDHQPHRQRDGGEHLEVDQGLHPDAADAREFSRGRDTGDDRAEHDRSDQHLDQRDEAGADRFQGDARGRNGEAEDGSQDDGHQHGDVELRVNALRRIDPADIIVSAVRRTHTRTLGARIMEGVLSSVKRRTPPHQPRAPELAPCTVCPKRSVDSMHKSNQSCLLFLRRRCHADPHG